jgi:hypothetical protein
MQTECRNEKLEFQACGSLKTSRCGASSVIKVR